MSYWGMSKRAYADRKCGDGIICSGWRKVRDRGVKFGAAWYWQDSLKEIKGELVHVTMNDYWQTEVMIQRGALGCTGFYCNAKIVLKGD